MLLAFTLALALPTEAEVFATLLARMDADGNGRLSHEEYQRVDDVTPISALDLDANGEIDVTELTAYVKVTPPRPQGRPPPTAQGSGAKPPPTGVAPPPPSTVLTVPSGASGPTAAVSTAAPAAAPPVAAPAPADAGPSTRTLALFGVGTALALGVGAWLGTRGRKGRRRRR